MLLKEPDMLVGNTQKIVFKLVGVYTPIFHFHKYTFFYVGTLTIDNISLLPTPPFFTAHNININTQTRSQYRKIKKDKKRQTSESL